MPRELLAVSLGADLVGQVPQAFAAAAGGPAVPSVPAWALASMPSHLLPRFYCVSITQEYCGNLRQPNFWELSN